MREYLRLSAFNDLAEYAKISDARKNNIDPFANYAIERIQSLKDYARGLVKEFKKAPRDRQTGLMRLFTKYYSGMAKIHIELYKSEAARAANDIESFIREYELRMEKSRKFSNVHYGNELPF
jgi:hypothetical protein